MKKILYPLLKEYPVTQVYGAVNQTSYYETHTGIDYGCPSESKILACDDGIVEFAGYVLGYGNLIKIKHIWGYSLYGHNKSFIAEVGREVVAGEAISLSDSTGWSTGDHLHFECRDLSDRVFDPTNYITNNINEVRNMLSPQEIDQCYIDCKHRHIHLNEITGNKDDSERNMYDFYKTKSLLEVYIDLLRDQEAYRYIEKGREVLNIPKEL